MYTIAMDLVKKTGLLLIMCVLMETIKVVSERKKRELIKGPCIQSLLAPKVRRLVRMIVV